MQREDRGEPEGSKLALKGLTKAFNGTIVVAGIDLEIRTGESIVLLGPSGCGKTTTLRMIAGFEQPDGGEIRLDGRIIGSSGVMLPPEQRRLGMVFQNYAVWPHKTVFDNVAYGLSVAKVPRAELRQRVMDALEAVKLTGLQGRYSSELSGGQQQRVALARAIVTRPSVLLLDEPLSNLDAGLRQEMRLELRELHRRTRMTSLYVTHDQEEALVLADRVVVMNVGVIEQIGSPEEIYYRPRNQFVAEFVGVNNLFGGVVEAVDLPGGKLCVKSERGLTLWAKTFNTGKHRVGERATVAIRPEHVSLRPEANVSATPGRIISTVFLGNRYDVMLDIAGHQVRCFCGRGQICSNENVEVWLDSEKIWVLP